MSSERPNRFILNTDYMSLAQAGYHQFNVVMPAGTTDASSTASISKDIRLPSVKGAIPRYLVSYETSVYDMETGVSSMRLVTIPSQGSFRLWTTIMGYPSWTIILSRKDNETLNVYAVVQTMNPNQNFDSITFKLRISYMYPPNV